LAFKLTPKQLEANKELAKAPQDELYHYLLEGGSRSAKTFYNIRNLVLRAQKAPGSRHVVFRSTFKACKNAIVQETFPKVIQLAFSGLKYNLNKTDWFASFENGSEIWFGGLDDKERTEKILGKEYATGFLNECSQISNDSRQMVQTRIAQSVMQKFSDGTEKPLALRMFYDCNPPSKAHWCFKMFHSKQDPETKKQLKNPLSYNFIKMNPNDNKENLPKSYIDSLDAMSPRYRKRFFLGEYSDENPNQLFSSVKIDENRVLDGEVPEFLRVVVAVDPSGSSDEDNAANDAIGIMVAGLGTDGKAYLLEDCTVKAGPSTWGRIATDAYERHEADVIVAESNFGGDMVRYVIQTAKQGVPFKFVHASRGKTVRAEPVASLYDLDKVRHVGYFPDLEDELEGFSTIGYVGEASPNRGDALVWAISELFPGVVAKPEEPAEIYYDEPDSWEAI